jgi:hypothetical protein
MVLNSDRRWARAELFRVIGVVERPREQRVGFRARSGLSSTNVVSHPRAPLAERLAGALSRVVGGLMFHLRDRLRAVSPWPTGPLLATLTAARAARRS